MSLIFDDLLGFAGTAFSKLSSKQDRKVWTFTAGLEQKKRNGRCVLYDRHHSYHISQINMYIPNQHVYPKSTCISQIKIQGSVLHWKGASLNWMRLSMFNHILSLECVCLWMMAGPSNALLLIRSVRSDCSMESVHRYELILFHFDVTSQNIFSGFCMGGTIPLCGMILIWSKNNQDGTVYVKIWFHSPISIWVFPKIGVPQNGRFLMENPIKMDDLGVPLFSETPICISSSSLELKPPLCLELKLHPWCCNLLLVQHRRTRKRSVNWDWNSWRLGSLQGRGDIWRITKPSGLVVGHILVKYTEIRWHK